MLSKDTPGALVNLIVFANQANFLFFFASMLGVTMARPVVVYEYLLIVALVSCHRPGWVIFGSFLALFVLDLMNQISRLYLFTFVELGQSIRYLHLYEPSADQFFLVVGFLAYLVLTYFWASYLSLHCTVSKKSYNIIILCFCIFVCLDVANGTSVFATRKVHIADENLGGSLFKDIGESIHWGLLTETSPTPLLEPPITTRLLTNDSIGNQLLVLVESWGLPIDPQNADTIQGFLSRHSQSRGWETKMGSTPFEGSTVHAELRELLGVKGDYRFFIDPKQAGQIRSIFTKKKKQGYSTIAVHSFSGRMFQRQVWWENIGVDSVYFFENLVKEASSRINRETPFVSIFDEDAFMFISTRATQQKRFGYLLTVNSHLPFHDSRQPKLSSALQTQLSTEALNQLDRILETILFIVDNGQKNDWSTILIIGDHMPPFTIAGDRKFYSQDRVPYLLLKVKSSK